MCTVQLRPTDVERVVWMHTHLCSINKNLDNYFEGNKFIPYGTNLEEESQFTTPKGSIEKKQRKSDY